MLSRFVSSFTGKFCSLVGSQIFTKIAALSLQTQIGLGTCDFPLKLYNPCIGECVTLCWASPGVHGKLLGPSLRQPGATAEWFAHVPGVRRRWPRGGARKGQGFRLSIVIVA